MNKWRHKYLTKSNKKVKQKYKINQISKEGASVKSYSYFRKSIGLKGPEIEKLTGYTKQGLYFAFNIIDEGRQPAKKFLVCINSAIDKEIEKEIKLHEEKMIKLRELKERFKEGNN